MSDTTDSSTMSDFETIDLPNTCLNNTAASSVVPTFKALDKLKVMPDMLKISTSIETKKHEVPEVDLPLSLSNASQDLFFKSCELELKEERETLSTFETSIESETQKNVMKNVDSEVIKTGIEQLEVNTFKDMTLSDNASTHSCNESETSTEFQIQRNITKNVDNENLKTGINQHEEIFLKNIPLSNNASIHSCNESETSAQTETDINFTKDIEIKNSKFAIKEIEENLFNNMMSDDTSMIQLTPIKTNEIDEKLSKKSIRDMLRCKPWPPISLPNFKGFQTVLAIHHLAPSLPIGLFEVFAEIIEVVTKTPVILALECREDRSIATNYVDIAVMPPDENWDDGELLPASFVFEHPLNKDKEANVYVDIILTKERIPYHNNIMDLRGRKWAIPHKRNQLTPSGLLFDHLHSENENMIFFDDNKLDVRTQLDDLELVLNKKAEVGIMESPVLKYHLLPEHLINSIHIFASMGPLPPYRIMVNKKTIGNPKLHLIEKLTTYLLKVNQYKEWKERLSLYGVVGFAKNSMDLYCSPAKS